MLISILLLTPLFGLYFISTGILQEIIGPISEIRFIALTTSIINVIISLIIWIIYDYSYNFFQFVRDNEKVSYSDFYFGLDGISIYFVLITTLITSIALLSNWISIKLSKKAYLVVILLLETLLLAVFLLLDTLSFYIFFESILPPAKWYGKSLLRVLLSNSGDYLKFLVPSLIWKIISGWINYSCKVKSQNMKETEKDNRGSKSLKVTEKLPGVKEQRVYGSKCFTSKHLRFTPEGFERNYQVKILSKQINKLRSYKTPIKVVFLLKWDYISKLVYIERMKLF